MDRRIQADKAFLKWCEKTSKNVVHIADAWYAAVEWADQTTLEKACKWLKKSTILADTTIERFRKAMEEQQ